MPDHGPWAPGGGWSSTSSCSHCYHKTDNEYAVGNYTSKVMEKCCHCGNTHWYEVPREQPRWDDPNPHSYPSGPG